MTNDSGQFAITWKFGNFAKHSFFTRRTIMEFDPTEVVVSSAFYGKTVRWYLFRRARETMPKAKSIHLDWWIL
jgi:hypothetical protein